MNKYFYKLAVCLVALFSLNTTAQETNFAKTLQLVEQNPKIKLQAELKADANNLPHSIYLPEGIFIDLVNFENGTPIYAVIKNILNPYESGELLSYEGIAAKYDLTNARIHYKNRVVNQDLGMPVVSKNISTSQFLLYCESTSDRVIAIDAVTGDVVDLNYIPTYPGANLTKQARLSPFGKITITDQNVATVFKFDTSGVFEGVFAPASGADSSIMYNLRGHNYIPSNKHLLVSVGGGTNANNVAEFDANGVFLGNFIISTAADSMASPYDILFRPSDILLSTSSSHAIYKYNLNGVGLGKFAYNVPFPQQMYRNSLGQIIVADFGVHGGIRTYDANGVLLRKDSVITANRGIFQLPNGHFLTTNAAGLHEVDNTNGLLVRTIIAGLAGQFITQFDFNMLPVELKTFNINIKNNKAQLTWSTASEMNNKGFSVQRAKVNTASWENIGWVSGSGTTTEIRNYSFIDNDQIFGNYFYRLKQMDFDGKFTYSNTVEVNASAPQKFEVFSNYPNPFNPSTKISFSITEKSNVNISVYDVLGNKVAQILNSVKEAGYHTVNFDASNFPSGIYFYKVQAGNFNAVRKMNLIK